MFPTYCPSRKTVGLNVVTVSLIVLLQVQSEHFVSVSFDASNVQAGVLSLSADWQSGMCWLREKELTAGHHWQLVNL